MSDKTVVKDAFWGDEIVGAFSLEQTLELKVMIDDYCQEFGEEDASAEVQNDLAGKALRRPSQMIASWRNVDNLVTPGPKGLFDLWNATKDNDFLLSDAQRKVFIKAGHAIPQLFPMKDHESSSQVSSSDETAVQVEAVAQVVDDSPDVVEATSEVVVDEVCGYSESRRFEISATLQSLYMDLPKPRSANAKAIIGVASRTISAWKNIDSPRWPRPFWMYVLWQRTANTVFLLTNEEREVFTALGGKSNQIPSEMPTLKEASALVETDSELKPISDKRQAVFAAAIELWWRSLALPRNKHASEISEYSGGAISAWRSSRNALTLSALWKFYKITKNRVFLLSQEEFDYLVSIQRVIYHAPADYELIPEVIDELSESERIAYSKESVIVRTGFSEKRSIDISAAIKKWYESLPLPRFAIARKFLGVTVNRISAWIKRENNLLPAVLFIFFKQTRDPVFLLRDDEYAYYSKWKDNRGKIPDGMPKFSDVEEFGLQVILDKFADEYVYVEPISKGKSLSDERSTQIANAVKRWLATVKKPVTKHASEITGISYKLLSSWKSEKRYPKPMYLSILYKHSSDPIFLLSEHEIQQLELRSIEIPEDLLDASKASWSIKPVPVEEPSVTIVDENAASIEETPVKRSRKRKRKKVVDGDSVTPVPDIDEMSATDRVIKHLLVGMLTSAVGIKLLVGDNEVALPAKLKGIELIHRLIMTLGITREEIEGTISTLIKDEKIIDAFWKKLGGPL